MNCTDNKGTNWPKMVTLEPKLDKLEWLLPEMGEDLAKCKEQEPLWRSKV